MATRMQQRKGTAAQWISTNGGDGPILNAGEIGYESDTNKFKIGDGVNHWVDLNYFADVVELGGSIDDYIPLTQRGTANGVATLNADGVIPSSQIPSLVGLDTEITSAVNAAVNNLVDGAPGALNTLNEFALALANDQNFAATVTTNLGYKQDKVANVTNTNISHLEGTTSGIQAQINAKAATADIEGLANQAIGASLVAGTGLDKSYDNVSKVTTLNIDSTVASQTFVNDGISTHSSDTTLVHGIADTSKLATVDGAETLTFKTLSDPTIVVDPTGSNISISATELGYLNNVSSNIQTQINAKAASADIAVAAQDAVGGSIGTGLAYDTGTNVLSVNQTTMQARVADVSDTEIGYLNGVTSAIQTQINDANTSIDAKLPKAGGTMTGALTLSGAPTVDLHAATKAYVDNVVSGLNFHQPVRVATTANITLSGTQTIDGVSLSVGDRVLVKDQTTGTENGIYVVASSTWSRATDADNTPEGELKGGDFTLVLEGTTLSGYGYVCSNTSAITIGTTNVTYAAFNAAKAVLAGNGLSEATPGVLSIDTAVTQARVADVSDTEIGYLNGVTSAIQTQIDNKANSLVTIDPETASYTLILTNQEQMVEMNVSSANTLTVPTNSSVAFPVGTRIHVVQTGTGQTTITPAGGVTVNGTPGLKTRAQWSAVTLVKRATDTWVAFGDLTA